MSVLDSSWDDFEAAAERTGEGETPPDPTGHEDPLLH